MSRRDPWGKFFQNFDSAYNLGNKVGRQIGMARAANLSPEAIDTQTLGAETTAGTEGKVYDSDIGQYLPQYLHSDGSPTTQALAQQNTPADGESAAPVGMQPTFSAKTTTSYKMGGKVQDKPFTDREIDANRLGAMSGVALNYGDPMEAARFDALAAERRKIADQDEIYKILAGDKPQGQEIPLAPVPGNQSAASTALPAVTAAPGMQKQVGYLDAVGPRVMDAYLKQGKVAEAKAWRDFTESEQGHAYANDFAQALRMVTAGDFNAAAPVLEHMFNRGYPNGQQVKLSNLGDGNFKADVFDEKTGQQIGSRTMPAADMGKMAISALAPTKLVEFMAQQHGKREAEGASLNKSLEIERLRQQGADVRDDRREERLQQRLDAQAENIERRLSTQGARGGLTAAQQRANAEIDAAREAVAGLSPQDIMRRTAKATNTGRENPDYDPGLARQAALANRRKIGDDEMFDQPKPKGGDVFAGKPLAELTEGQLQQFARSAGQDGKVKIDAEIARRTLAGMPQMQGHQIGQYIEGKGYQVLDPQGRPVSYLRRKQ